MNSQCKTGHHLRLKRTHATSPLSNWELLFANYDFEYSFRLSMVQERLKVKPKSQKVRSSFCTSTAVTLGSHINNTQFEIHTHRPHQKKAVCGFIDPPPHTHTYLPVSASKQGPKFFTLQPRTQNLGSKSTYCGPTVTWYYYPMGHIPLYLQKIFFKWLSL